MVAVDCWEAVHQGPSLSSLGTRSLARDRAAPPSAPAPAPGVPPLGRGAMKTPDLKNVNWKDVFIGDYDWAFLCTPRLPWSVSKQPPPFYGKDEPISVFVAFIMGLQHCLTMVRKGGA